MTLKGGKGREFPFSCKNVDPRLIGTSTLCKGFYLRRLHNTIYVINTLFNSKLKMFNRNVFKYIVYDVHLLVLKILIIRYTNSYSDLTQAKQRMAARSTRSLSGKVAGQRMIISLSGKALFFFQIESY